MTGIQARNSKILQKKNDNTEKPWFWSKEPSMPRELGKMLTTLAVRIHWSGLTASVTQFHVILTSHLPTFAWRMHKIIKKTAFSIVEQA